MGISEIKLFSTSVILDLAMTKLVKSKSFDELIFFFNIPVKLLFVSMYWFTFQETTWGWI